MANDTYCVYRHVSPSGKVYIGITCRVPRYRWNNGNGYPHNAYFNNAIQRYGWDNFKHEILLEGLTKEQAELAEQLFIGYYHSNEREFGYNIESGGNANGKHSAETKQKIGNGNRGKVVSAQTRARMSKAQKGHKVSQETREKLSKINTGKRHTEATKQKIAEKLRGEKSYMYGTHLSDERKAYLSKINSGKNHPRYGQPCPEKTKKKISNAHKKPVVALNRDTMQIMFVCNSIQEAAVWVGCNSGNISMCCKGKRPTAGGYAWAYADIKEVG